MSTKVLIVDDSALMRALLKDIIAVDPGLEVVGAARDAYDAREQIKALNPDVITLDVEMPGMDGIEFLSRLMRLRPMPVVMVSSLTAEGSEATLRALELGAVDFVQKPAGGPGAVAAIGASLREKLRVAAGARLRPKASAATAAPRAKLAGGASSRRIEHLIAIGASTGGTEAIREVLVALPADAPPVLLVQHMPDTFTPSFARRLDGCSALHVNEATEDQRLEVGHAYLAPGHSHLLVERVGDAYFTRLSRAEPVNRHRPSVDVLFRSLVEVAKVPVTAALLSGMGRDGAQGLLALRAVGAHTLAQDQETCVVYGMPRAAVELDAVDEVLPLERIATAIESRFRRRGGHRAEQQSGWTAR